MPTPKKGPRLGGSPAHHDQIIANLTTELIRHGRIRTTHARAKNVQPVAERMITLGKRGDLHARRRANRVIRDDEVLHRLFTEVGPANAQRPGGYTRVLKLGPRKGDAAPMAVLELVAGGVAEERGGAAETGGRRWSLRRSRQAEGAAGAAAATATAPAAALEPEEAEEPDEVADDDAAAEGAADDDAAADEAAAGDEDETKG